MNEGSTSSEEEVKSTVMEEKSEEQRGSVEKVRSCKGYLYYSSILKSKSKNPRCVGIPRNLRQVPDFVVRPPEARALKGDFYYGCLGYSLFITTQKDSSPNNQHTTNTQIPVCLGLKITAGDIVDRRVSSAYTSSVPARVQNTNATPNQHQNHKPAPATSTNTENGFITRTVMEEKSEQQRGSLEKGRSCKGYLYYSSTLKSKSKNPRCVGIPRNLRQVPDYVVRQSEAKASKEGRTLADFYYGCLGYSVYMTEKDSSAIKQHSKAQLPLCVVGFEMLADRRAASGNTSSVPARVQNRNESRELPQRQNHKPEPATATNTENGFITRFTRNANLVASGVMKNMKRVGNYAKKTMDDALDTYRKRPK